MQTQSSATFSSSTWNIGSNHIGRNLFGTRVRIELHFQGLAFLATFRRWNREALSATADDIRRDGHGGQAVTINFIKHLGKENRTGPGTEKLSSLWFWKATLTLKSSPESCAFSASRFFAFSSLNISSGGTKGSFLPPFFFFFLGGSSRFSVTWPGGAVRFLVSFGSSFWVRSTSRTFVWACMQTTQQSMSYILFWRCTCITNLKPFSI